MREAAFGQVFLNSDAVVAHLDFLSQTQRCLPGHWRQPWAQERGMGLVGPWGERWRGHSEPTLRAV